MPKIKYVQLEPAAYLSDTDWLMMSGEDRGIYHTLIIYLYCNDGKLKYDAENFCNICNVSCETFETFWKKFEKKFQRKIGENGHIKHKRVNRQLNKARKLIKQRSLAGKASGNARSTDVPTNDTTKAELNKTKRNETKLKEIKRNETKEKPSSSVKNSLSFSLRFADQLDKIINPFSQNDKMALVNLIHWLKEQQSDNQIYENVLEYARNAKTGRNPIAVFFATLRREIGYQGKG